MRLWYGNYAFPSNGCEVTSRSETIFSYAGVPLRYVVTVDVTAYLDGAGQAALTLQENALRVALAIPYRDLVFRQDDGTPSGIWLRNAASYSGVRCVRGPDFINDARDGEYVIQRSARFSIAGEFIIRGTEGATVAFQETLSRIGNGGPSRRWRFPINGPAIRQVVSPSSLVTTIQSGFAVGHTRRPDPPPSLFPQFLVNERTAISDMTPKPLGQAYVEFGVRWNYIHESDRPLLSLPNLPPL